MSPFPSNPELQLQVTTTFNEEDPSYGKLCESHGKISGPAAASQGLAPDSRLVEEDEGPGTRFVDPFFPIDTRRIWVQSPTVLC